MESDGETESTEGPEEITVLLKRLGDGDKAASDRLMPLVYRQLRALAGSFMRSQRPDHTLQPTALANEAYIKLIGGAPVSAENRQHFFALAARAMRQILVDHARRRQTAKRGGDQERVALEDTAEVAAPGQHSVDLLDLDVALGRLHELHSRQSKVVELRFFGGLTIDETSNVLRVSTDTVEDDWAMARVWLKRALRADPATNDR